MRSPGRPAMPSSYGHLCGKMLPITLFEPTPPFHTGRLGRTLWSVPTRAMPVTGKVSPSQARCAGGPERCLAFCACSFLHTQGETGVQYGGRTTFPMLHLCLPTTCTLTPTCAVPTHPPLQPVHTTTRPLIRRPALASTPPRLEGGDQVRGCPPGPYCVPQCRRSEQHGCPGPPDHRG